MRPFLKQNTKTQSGLIRKRIVDIYEVRHAHERETQRERGGEGERERVIHVLCIFLILLSLCVSPCLLFSFFPVIFASSLYKIHKIQSIEITGWGGVTN